jgi:hypothetical protein
MAVVELPYMSSTPAPPLSFLILDKPMFIRMKSLMYLGIRWAECFGGVI